MEHVNPTKGWATTAAVGLLLSPIILIFCIPLAISSGINIFVFGEAPLTLALCAPTLVVLLRGLSAPAGADGSASTPNAKLPLGQIPELF
jgi:hypothetical protein